MLQKSLAPGVTSQQLLVFSAALLSLFIDQSFSGAYGAIQADLGGSLSSSADELSWASVSYNACYDTMILLTPWLVKRFGRRNVFASGHISFFAFTAYLAFTSSLGGFVGGRAIEGLAQGTFFVCSAMTILTLFPAQYRGYTFSIFSIFSLSGAAAGPFIGGWFFDHATCAGALVFYGLLALVAGLIIGLLMDGQTQDKAQRIDAIGTLLVFIMFFAIQFVAAFGERNAWFGNGAVAKYASLALICAAAFVARELVTTNPLTPLRLYHIRNLAVGSVLGFGLGAPLFGANGFLLYTEQQLGFPPSTAGALLLLRILAVVLIAPVAVMLVNADKISVRVPVIVGFLLIAGAYEMLSWRTTFDSAFDAFVPAMLLSGAGFACSFSPIANVIVRSLPATFAGEGIAIFKIVLVLGGTFGTTLLNVLFDRDFAGFFSLVMENATARHLSHAVSAASAVQLANLASIQASILAYENNLQWVAIVGIVVLPLAVLLQKPSPPAATQKATAVPTAA